MADPSKRTIAKSQFTRAENVLKRDLEAEENAIPITTLERHQKEFSDKWQKAQDEHDMYVLTLGELTEEEKNTEEAWLQELSVRFSDMEIKVDVVVEQRKQIAKSEIESVTEETTTAGEDTNEVVVTAEVEQSVPAENVANHAARPEEVAEQTLPVPVATTELDNQENTEEQQKQRIILEQQQQLEMHKQNLMLQKQQQQIEFEQQQLLLQQQQQQQQQPQQQQRNQQNVQTPVVNGDAKQNNNATQYHSQPISRLKIKPLDIQHFAGDIRKFAQFKDEFHSLIKPLCSTNQLALALRNHLTDEVRASVDSVGNDYEKIWKRLESKYGTTRRLVDAILRDVKTMPNEGDDIGNALEMIDIVEKAHLDLEAIGEEQELHNGTIISLIEERMPSEMMSEWVKRVAGEQHLRSQEKFQALLELLINWRYRLEYLNDSIRCTSSITLHVQGATDNNKSKNTCWIHKETGDHPIWRCRVFRAKSVEERIQLTKDNKACVSCLEVGHGPDNCKKNFVCKIDDCNQNHNQLLHKGPGPPPGAVLPQQ